MEKFDTQRWQSHEVARLIAFFESERRFYEEIVTLLPIPVATVGVSGAILAANNAFLRTFDVKRDDLERHSLTLLFGNNAWTSALLPREPGILATATHTAHFTPIPRWDRAETEWMVAFLPLPPAVPAATPLPDPAAAELAATTAAIAAAQRLAGRVTHETNNLVMIASGYGREILQQLPPESPLREDVSMLLGATGRIEAMAAQLNEFSQVPRASRATYALHEVLPATGYHLEPLPAPDTPVATDRAALSAVFAALAAQAKQTLSMEAVITAQEAVLTVKGFGMSAESLRQCFEVLNKAAREGAVGARECALIGPKLAQAGVRWRVTDSAALEMRLPRAERGEALPAAAPGNRTALVVDDQSGIRTIVRRILEGNGFQVAEAGSAEEALSLLDRNREPYDLLVTDMRMPGMTGRDLADRVRYRHPETRVLFMSGFTDDPSVQSGILPPQSRFLAKPFHPEQFLGAIGELMS